MPNETKKITSDFWAKVFSLLLAILIWSTIKFAAIQRGIEPRTSSISKLEQREYAKVPITVLTEAQDTRIFKVSPSTVRVVVSGDPVMLQQLQPADLEVFVNLTEPVDAPLMHKPIRVNARQGLRVEQIDPPIVEVQQIGRISN